MKHFFQGLVLGAALMYWYLNYSAGFFVQIQDWFDHTASEYRDDRGREEADHTLHGFLSFEYDCRAVASV
jgi:hypothetical protein